MITLKWFKMSYFDDLLLVVKDIIIFIEFYWFVRVQCHSLHFFRRFQFLSVCQPDW